jgi:peptide/nickel transport system substrate-binding protein
MNMFESLMTRDENFNPILELANSIAETPDHLTYTFKLRQGIRFHNGKELTSADVVASFDRYAKVGLYRSTLGNVDRWDAPDKDTFVIHLKKVQPTFLEILSAVSAPIVIVPAEDKEDPPMQLKTIGTGPWQLVESVPGGYVKMKRYEGYKPNTNFAQKTGFGGYRQACFDTVTFRIVTEPQARVAGLKTGELQGVEDLPTKSLADLKADKSITIIPLQNWWIQIAQPNVSVPPTDNLTRSWTPHQTATTGSMSGSSIPTRPSTRMRARRHTTSRIPSWQRSTSRNRATRVSRSSCSPTRTIRRCTIRRW